MKLRVFLYARVFAVVRAALLTVVLVGCNTADGVKRKGIITMGPHLTETVFALGQGKRVIAVGSFDDYPPEIWSLPKTGGYLDPDLEKITQLAPELVFLPGEHHKMSKYATLHQLSVVNVHMDSFETIYAGIREIGRALGCEKEAEKLCEQIRGDMEKLRAITKEKPHPTVLIVTSRPTHSLKSLHTVSDKSFVSEMIALAGATNLYAGTSAAYFEASMEGIVAKAPDVIVEFHSGERLTARQRQAYINDWQILASVPAVQNERIYIITGSHGLRPGPRVVEMAWDLAEHLHPEVGLLR